MMSNIDYRTFRDAGHSAIAPVRDVSELLLESIVGADDEHVSLVRFSPHFPAASLVAICFTKTIAVYELTSTEVRSCLR
jgi:hypothetical protein